MQADGNRYLNLCYGDPLFSRNPSLGNEASTSASGGNAANTSGNAASGLGQRPPGGGTKECRYLHFHVQSTKERYALEPTTGAEEGIVVPDVIKRAVLNPDSGDIVEGANSRDLGIAAAESDREGDRARSGVQTRRDSERAMTEKQWVNCDLRSFDYSVLGQ